MLTHTSAPGTAARRGLALRTAGAAALLGLALWVGLSSPGPALAAGTPPIAVNVDGIADFMSSAAYIDATAYFRRWGMPGAGWQVNPRLKLTPDNLPLSDADAISHLRGYPDGVYKLRFEGGADVSVFGIGSIVEGTLRKDPARVSTADVRIAHRGPDDLITLQVRNVDPANPLRRLQLLAPGYADATAVFRTEFVRRVRPFAAIRFMDWQQTNGSPVKEWADRVTPTAFGRTSAKGVPIEEIVLLANQTKRDVWVNIPQGASDDYVKQFATFLRDNLHADALIRFEYSNELWNFGFEQARENLKVAKANGGLTKPDDFGRSAQQAADKLGTFARIFKEAFGDAAYARRVRPVVGGFIAVAYWGQTQLDWLKAKHPGLVKEIAIAPYFGVEGDIKDVDVPGATADALFKKLNDWIDGQIAPWIDAYAKLCTDYGVSLVAYEGGNHLTATNNLNEQTKIKMQNDPRMAQTYQHLFDVWTKRGGGTFVQFGHIGPYTRFGCWGLLERADQTGSVKWDYFMSRLLPPGDADLDGQVTEADAKTVKAFFHRRPANWETGDFNADGEVDGADVQLLLRQAKSLPPEVRKDLEGLGRR